MVRRDNVVMLTGTKRRLQRCQTLISSPQVPTSATRLSRGATCGCNVILATLLFACLIKSVGQQTNKQRNDVPRTMVVTSGVMLIGVSTPGRQHAGASAAACVLFMMQRADKRRRFCKAAHLFSLRRIRRSAARQRLGRSNVRPADSHTATPGSS